MNHFCRHASRLSSESMERPLTMSESIRLRLHLMICTGCTNYDHSIKLLHQTLENMRKANEQASLSTDARERIKLAVLENT